MCYTDKCRANELFPWSRICEDCCIQVLKQCTINVSMHVKLGQSVILTHIILDLSTDLVRIVSGAEYCAIRTEDVNCFFDLFHCVSARESIHNLHKNPVFKSLKLVAALQLVSTVMLSQYWAKSQILDIHCDRTPIIGVSISWPEAICSQHSLH